LFRIIDFLSLLFDDHAAVQEPVGAPTGSAYFLGPKCLPA
jgi:hypothetical protein